MIKQIACVISMTAKMILNFATFFGLIYFGVSSNTPMTVVSGFLYIGSMIEWNRLLDRSI